MKSGRLLLLILLIAVSATVGKVLQHQAAGINNANADRLIKTSENDEGRWMSQEEISQLIHNNIKFIDTTDLVLPNSAVSPADQHMSEIPSRLRYQSLVQSVFPRLNTTRMRSFIQSFSSYYNRHYNTVTGQESAEWLLNQVNSFIASIDYQGNTSVQEFTHSSWRQQSVIARIEGADPSLREEVVILGAHEDSILSGGNPQGNSPGADDNGSGSVVLLETFRALLESGFVPRRSIEFQWYAAEEVGLRGSGAIASLYYSTGVQVVSMTNFDVIGYHTQGLNEIALTTDYTDPTLTAFLRLVIDEYCIYSWANVPCGYACSDHASFYRYDFRAAFPLERIDNPNMHTVRDTIDLVNFTQVLEFVKLALGYAIEIAEPL